MKINAKMLKGTCGEDEFREVFGDKSVTPTEKACLAVADKVSWDEAAGFFLNARGMNAYNKVVNVDWDIFAAKAFAKGCADDKNIRKKFLK